MERDIQKLIDLHRGFKARAMDLSMADLFARVELKEQMKEKVIELKSQYIETKAQLEKDKALRTLELKSEVDENGKKLTEKAIDSTLLLEFQDRVADLNALTKYRELLSEYADNVLEYVNIIKLNVKNDLPF